MTYKEYIEPDWTRPIRPVPPVGTLRFEASRNQVSMLAETIDKEVIDKLTSEAVKADGGKSDWSLMPFEAVEEINKVLEFGAKKYAAHNWKIGNGFKYTRLLNSLLRHIFAYMRGEDKDPESGLSHLAHAGCNVIFLLYYEKYKAKYSNDDRV